MAELQIVKPFEAVVEEPLHCPAPGEPGAVCEVHHAEHLDINNIMKKYGGGLVPQYPGGTFEELPRSLDYHEAVNLVMNAGETFAELPSDIRDRFGNDPQAFLSFMENPENLAEQRELGLVPGEKAPGAPVEAVPVPAEPTPAAE